MLGKFFSTKLSKVIIIAAISVLLIFFNPQNILDPVRSVVKTLLTPFQKVIYLLSVRVKDLKKYTSSIASLRLENEKLIRENMALQAEKAKLEDTKRQSEILKEQLKMLPRDKFELENAFVIGQNSSMIGNWIEISKGSASGIEPGMPVIVSQGILIGTVDVVDKDNAKIILVTNPESAVSAMVASTGVKGISRGEYGLGILFDMVLQTDEIKDGDDIITAGSGKFMPRGLFIGTLKDVRMSPDRLFQQAVIWPPVDFLKLEVVSVIKKINGT